MCDLTGHCDWQSNRVEHSGITWGLPEAAEAVSAATGEDWSLERTDDALRRKRLLETAYNMLCEILTGNPSEPTDAYMRMWEDPIPDGFFKGRGIRGIDKGGVDVHRRKEIAEKGVGSAVHGAARYDMIPAPEHLEECTGDGGDSARRADRRLHIIHGGQVSREDIDGGIEMPAVQETAPLARSPKSLKDFRHGARVHDGKRG